MRLAVIGSYVGHLEGAGAPIFQLDPVRTTCIDVLPWREFEQPVQADAPSPLLASQISRSSTTVS